MSPRMSAGQLNPDAPTVWGELRYSAHAGLWMWDWYDARALLIGCTIADAEAYQWAEGHKAELEDQRAKREAFRKLKSVEFYASRPAILDDEIPF